MRASLVERDLFSLVVQKLQIEVFLLRVVQTAVVVAGSLINDFRDSYSLLQT